MAYTHLASAKENKKDEFYTQLIDIENELKNYTKHFKDKVVLCNCDDIFCSNFVKYFLINFNKLGLKKLIAIGYRINKEKSDVALMVNNTKVYLRGIKEDLEDCDIKDFLETESSDILLPIIENKTLKQDSYYKTGDFRSGMSLRLLEESDIVVTNPPFSLFREFVSLLVKYNKQFLIVGNQNAITYKEIFPLIKENKIWLGYGFKGNVGFFESPYEDIAVSTQHKEGKIRISGVMWFTNIDHSKRHQMLPLNLNCTYKNYENLYPLYDNYNAINVNKTTEIPCDYKGVMGVPITFLSSFSPDQFEILGLSSKDNYGSVKRFHDNSFYNGYTRGKVVTRIESNMPILNVSNKGGTLCKKEGCPNLYQLYWRIFIKFTDNYIKLHPKQFNNM
jgi:hypothetical protein